MTLAFPSYRNSFHPAWLLLLVPPLVGFLVNFTNDSGLVDFALILRVILAAGLILPVIWLRLDQVSGRTQRLLKELRMQMPGCLVAMLLPGVLGWANGGDVTEWIIGTYGFGCLLLGAAAFGSEFDQRTLPGLLTQPLSRPAIFAEKLGVLGVLFLVATGNLWLTLSTAPNFGFDSEAAAFVVLVPLFALCSGPLYSLLSRSTLAGLVFVVAIPMGLGAVIMLGLESVFRLGLWETGIPPGVEARLILWGMPAYLLVTFVAGWRVFAGLQVRDGGAGGRSSTGMHPLSLPIDRILRRVLPVTGGMAQLVRKELRLHVVPWLVAGIMVGLWLLGMTLKHFASDESLKAVMNDVSAFAVFAGILGTLVLVTAGAACVAEERELGTLEWQLTQPVALGRQWRTKVLVAVAIATGLGFLLPATLLWVSFDGALLRTTFGDLPALVAAAYGSIFLLLLVVSIYASSIARNTMKATATATFIAGGLAAVIAVMGLTGGAWIDRELTRHVEQWPPDVNAPAWAPTVDTLRVLGATALAGVTAALAFTLLAFGGQNFRRLTVPAATISRQLVAVAVGLTVLLGAIGLVTSQLVLLATQANQAETFVALRRSAVIAVGQELRLGRLTEELAGQIGVATNATPEAVVDALIAREGNQAFVRIQDRFRPKQQVIGSNPAFLMDPVLARRYGLVTVPSSANRTNSTQAAKTNAPSFKMDPELMKRYGLQPAVPKP